MDAMIDPQTVASLERGVSRHRPGANFAATRAAVVPRDELFDVLQVPARRSAASTCWSTSPASTI